MSEMSLGNLYDFNKNLVEQTDKEMTGFVLDNKLHNKVRPYFEEKVSFSIYFMLLCHELRDYTIFHVNDICVNTSTLIKELKECLQNRGQIYSIERTEDNVALEIWIKQDNEMYCYYLFPYDEGVIEI